VLKWFLSAVSVAILLVLGGQQARAQSGAVGQARVAEREAEWNQYVLPQSTFVRQTDPANAVLFRVPSEWTRQQPDKLNFLGPHGATLSVIIEKIPDGIPLRDYVSAMLQQLRSLTDSADSMVVRRTTMSAFEAREIMFESNAGSAEVSRRIVWSTVSGPNAVSLILITPIANVAEIEPYFKAVVQSVTLVDKYNYAGFEALRSTVFEDSGPTRVDEVQSAAASLTAIDGSSRQSTIARLASIFASSPGTAIDLVLDGRPMVRAAVIEAIAQSRNNSLETFLLRALDDHEVFVAEQAARSIAQNPKVIDLLRDHSLEWFKIEPLARVWPFLNRSNQIKILEEAFSQPVAPPPASRAETSSGKPRVTVRATVLPPGSPPPPVVIQARSLTSDPSRQLNALTLLEDFPASEFKLPLTTILAAKNDTLTTLALQIAWRRNELLPAAELMKLLSSSNNEVRRLAALNLGQSGSVADIKRIEGYSNKPVTPAGPTPLVNAGVIKPTEPDPSLNSDLQFTIARLRLREQLSTASDEARRQLIKKSLTDPKLAEWIWYRYVRENFDRERSAVESKSQVARPTKVLPLGENLFPKDVTYYAALPQPATALDKLGSALDGLQLESARSQANLVLILSVLREQLAQQLNSPLGASPIIYSGINIREPIALASWVAESAPDGIQSAERNAIILRVTDRGRFERSLTLYQRSIGNFRGLTDYFSGIVRFLTVLPAFLPLSAKAILDGSLAPSKSTALLKYSFVGRTEWNGYSIKVVEHRRVDSDGHITKDAAYLTYLGDTAVLAPDLDSLRDVLTRASSEQPSLATNTNFKRLIENGAESPGEAIYLSNLRQLVADPSVREDSQKDAVTESGALKISNSTWENFYQIQFTRTDWVKPFIDFQPEELTSPRELLPRATIAYYFMNFDAVAGWRDWSPHLFGAEQRKDLASIWAIDFEKEVLPELGPECGVAVLGLPNILTGSWDVPWAVFFKLKTDKLARALEAGKLLGGASAGPGSTPTHFKLGSGDFFVIVKGSFLVLSNNRLAITALDQKEKLISSRDFSRAAKRAPAGVVAFGGYNLEAAISAIGDSGGDPIKTQQSSLISSLTTAFHSPNFYATATSDALQGRFSLSMDREGRFSVSELSSLTKDYRLTYAQVEARGVPIQNQERLSSLKLRIRASAAGEIDRIKEDVSSTYQIAEKISDKELVLTVLPRHSEPKTSLALPIKGSEFAPYLQPANDIHSDDKSVIEKARSIAGDERDAWKVASKLADWTYKNIKWKRVDYATAEQTLATLEADCLEFSQLYVAMARSLGLPARLVSGLAYSGSAFGGHAWVEVYVGDWIEVDPTWGTDFVDATHIRNLANGALLTYASLNLIELEVLEAPRGVAEFQKDPRALAEKLNQELPKGSITALTSALDLAVLTDENLGSGTWVTLSDAERETMTSAYRRLLLEINTGFRRETKQAQDLQLLKVTQSGERAEAVVRQPGSDESLEKFSFVHRNGAWFLTEILQVDTDLHIISETLQPTIKTILERRNNKSARGQSTSDFVRVLLVMEKDPKASIAIADLALKNDPKNRGLRHLKALVLARNESHEDAIQLWKELATEAKPFGPALLYLARQYDNAEDKAKQKLAIEFYTRYGELEPEDPRTHVALARLYENSDDDVHAEAEHRAALKSDPANTEQFVDFAAFLARRKRLREAASVIDEADKKAGVEDDLFGDLMVQLYLTDEKTVPEELARSQPQRMEKSAVANLYLGYLRLENGKSLQAIPLLKKAAALKNDWVEPHGAMARGYRTLRNWTAALNAADTAIKIDPEDSDGYFNRACALARLGRIKEALKSLEKAVELDPDLPELLTEEADLRVLASNPAFKKLIAGQDGKR
jgi:transglutaminase-like putative cysteine protease/tetratricopeptide (TPR) repeat protein